VKPQTLRTIGLVCIVFGIGGLAYTLVLVALAASGTGEPPSTFTALWVPIQSIVNLLAGWNLRRQAGE